jgi:hypothetical protein
VPLHASGRAFADIGSHWCDLVEFVSGERFAALAALTSIAVPERPAGSAQAFSAAGATPAMTVTTEDIAVGDDGPISVEWEDAGMDRAHGAAEAVKFVRSLLWATPGTPFDAAFSNQA